MPAADAPSAPLRLVTGPAGCGKTKLALDLVREAATAPGRRGRHARRGADALLVLPTYAQALHLKRVALSRWDARAVLDDVFTTFTAAGERFLPGFRVRALPAPEERDRLMEEALRRADVEAFRRVADRPGFRRRLLRLTKEVKQSGLAPAEAASRLEESLDLLEEEGGRERLAGFLAVFAAYHELLASARLEDHEDALRRLLDRLRDATPDAAPSLLVVDGFEDLTPIEDRILEALADATVAGGGRVVVTLAWDATRPALFAASAPWRERLLAHGFREERLEGFPRAAGTALEAVAARLFGGRGDPPAPADGTIGTLVAGDDDDEAEAVARHARRLRKAGRLGGWRELGIVLRRVEEAGPRFVAAFERLGIPARVVGAGHPLGAEALLRALRGPLRILGGAVEAGRFEPAALLAWGRWLALAEKDEALGEAMDALEMRWRRGRLPATFAAVREEAEGPWAERLAVLAARQEALAHLEGPAACFGAIAEAIGALAPLPPAGGLDAAGRVRDEAADRHRVRAAAARERLEGIVEGLARAARRTGLGGGTRAGDAVGEVLEAVDAARVAVPDRRLDVVNVLDAETSRFWELPVVVVAGLSEGRFPLHPIEDVLLRDDERKRLAEASGGLVLPLAREREVREQRLFYAAVTRARRHLVLARSGCDADGDPRAPSFFLRDLERVAEATPVEPPRPPGQPAPALEACHTRGDLARFAALRAGDEHAPVADRAMARALLDALGGDARRRAARWWRPQADALDHLAPADLARFAASVDVVSPSTLNAAVACRHRHFLARVVGVPEDDAPLAGRGFDARDTGRIVHEALRRAVAEPGLDAATLAAEVVAAEAPTLPAWDRDLLEADVARMVDLMRRREAAHASALRPLPDALELGFGLEEDGLPPVAIGEGPAAFSLRGRIDRVDAAAGRALVVDYKLGVASVRSGAKGFDEGDDLQLPLYALALERLRGDLAVVGLEWVAARARDRRAFVSEEVAEDAARRREGVAPRTLTPAGFRARLEQAAARAAETVAAVRGHGHAKQRVDPDVCSGCAWRVVCRPRFEGPGAAPAEAEEEGEA